MLTITNETLPVSLSDLKDDLHIDGTYDDSQLTRCLTAGVNMVEYMIEKDLVTRQWDQKFDCFKPSLTLDRGPLQSIDGFTYLDVDEVEQDFTDYVIEDYAFRRPVLTIKNPIFGSDLVVSYTTGGTCPLANQMVLYAAAHFYLNREAEVIGVMTTELKIGLTRIAKLLRAKGYR